MHTFVSVSYVICSAKITRQQFLLFFAKRLPPFQRGFVIFRRQKLWLFLFWSGVSKMLSDAICLYAGNDGLNAKVGGGEWLQQYFHAFRFEWLMSCFYEFFLSVTTFFRARGCYHVVDLCVKEQLSTLSHFNNWSVVVVVAFNHRCSSCRLSHPMQWMACM